MVSYQVSDATLIGPRAGTDVPGHSWVVPLPELACPGLLRRPGAPVPGRYGPNLVQPLQSQALERAELIRKSVGELHRIAEKLGVRGAVGLSKPALVDQIRRASATAASSGVTDIGPLRRGVLEILPEGYGFLRDPELSYASGDDDIYVSRGLIRSHALRRGDTLVGTVARRTSGNRDRRLSSIVTVNGRPVGSADDRPHFESLRARYPDRRIDLEVPGGSVAMRMVNLLAPVGRGQRGLIVSPPKAGKTTILRGMAQAVAHNHPGVHLIVMLIDERPEEVTEMKEKVKGEVIASTFDSPPLRHVQVADVVYNKACRLAEARRDVVILLDSLTRLARAHNAILPQSGRIMSGGMDARALERPKRFFGAARDLEDGGSITIVATALVDTGSRMDDLIFEEFKGTGNMELVLDRSSADRRIFPAIDLAKSGTRREELLLSGTELDRVHILRNFLATMPNEEAIPFLTEHMSNTATNAEFLDVMARGY